MFTKIIRHIESKPFNLSFLFVICLFLTDTYFLKPRIQENYFESILADFEYDYWTIFIISSIISYSILFISLLVFSKDVKINWKNVMLLIFPALLMVFILDRPLRNTTLYLNTKISNESVQKEYVGEQFGEHGIFYLTSKNEKIFVYNNELNKINASRKKNHQTVIDRFKNNDTISILFTKGFLDINYLK